MKEVFGGGDETREDGFEDAELSAWLAGPEIADDGFTTRFRARLARHSRQRRIALVGAGLVGSGLAIAATAAAPAPLALFSPATVVGALLLTGLCGAVWIGTETRAGH